MKLISKTVFVLALSGVSFISCEKDEAQVVETTQESAIIDGITAPSVEGLSLAAKGVSFTPLESVISIDQTSWKVSHIWNGSSWVGAKSLPQNFFSHKVLVGAQAFHTLDFNSSSVNFTGDDDGSFNKKSAEFGYEGDFKKGQLSLKRIAKLDILEKTGNFGVWNYGANGLMIKNLDYDSSYVFLVKK